MKSPYRPVPRRPSLKNTSAPTSAVSGSDFQFSQYIAGEMQPPRSKNAFPTKLNRSDFLECEEAIAAQAGTNHTVLMAHSTQGESFVGQMESGSSGIASSAAFAMLTVVTPSLTIVYHSPASLPTAPMIFGA